MTHTFALYSASMVLIQFLNNAFAQNSINQEWTESIMNTEKNISVISVISPYANHILIATNYADSTGYTCTLSGFYFDSTVCNEYPCNTETDEPVIGMFYQNSSLFVCSVSYDSECNCDSLITLVIRQMDMDLETVIDSASYPIPPNLSFNDSLTDIIFTKLPDSLDYPRAAIGLTMYNSATENDDVFVATWTDGDSTTNEVWKSATLSVLEGKNERVAAMVSNNNSSEDEIYIWGDVVRSITGTNKDCFLIKLNANLNMQFSKLHASYKNREDEAVSIKMDGNGRLYAISNSQDNTAEKRKHTALYKINASNGKKIWINRFGEASGSNELAGFLSVNESEGGNVFVTILNHNDELAYFNIYSPAGLLLNSIEYPKESFQKYQPTYIQSDSVSNAVYVCIGDEEKYYIAKYDENTFAPIWDAGVVTDSVSATGDLTSLNYLRILLNPYNSGFFVISDWTLDSEDAFTDVAYFVEYEVKDLSDVSGEAISIFPNPASQYIYIHTTCSYAVVEIIAMDGKIIDQETIYEQEMINISHIPSGTYLVKFRSGVVNEVRMLVIAR